MAPLPLIPIVRVRGTWGRRGLQEGCRGGEEDGVQGVYVNERKGKREGLMGVRMGKVNVGKGLGCASLWKGKEGKSGKISDVLRVDLRFFVLFVYLFFRFLRFVSSVVFRFLFLFFFSFF